jgi:hypothetical protein
MDDAISTDDNWIGNQCVIEDVTNGDSCTARITDVDQANDRIIIASGDVTFTIATSDKIRVFASKHPLASLNTYDPPTRTELTTDTNSILDRIIAAAQLICRSDAAIKADRAAELALINADEDSGAGNYDNETDSLELLADTQSSDSGDITAIKNKTDSLTFSVAGVVDSNLKRVADSNNFTSSGTGGQKYGPAS